MCKSFNKGTLYIRINDGKAAELFYPDEEVKEGYATFHCKHIARIHWGKGEPDFGGWVEYAQNGQRSGSGMLIEFRKATDADIKSLFDVWGGNYSLADWVKEVCEYSPILSHAEKDRLARIAKPYIT